MGLFMFTVKGRLAPGQKRQFVVDIPGDMKEAISRIKNETDRLPTTFDGRQCEFICVELPIDRQKYGVHPTDILYHGEKLEPEDIESQLVEKEVEDSDDFVIDENNEETF